MDEHVLPKGTPIGADYLAALRRGAEQCNRIAYHQVTAIQPHGMFWALDASTFQVVAASRNVCPDFAPDLDQVWGRDFLAWIDPEHRTSLKQFLCSAEEWRFMAQRFGTLFFASPLGHGPVAFAAYRSGPFLCIEIARPGPASEPGQILDMQGKLNATLRTLPEHHADLSTAVAKALRQLTGFDRAYVLRFDLLGHGVVEGEAGNGSLPILLGHHFPATDIPEVVRDLLVKARFRHFPDVQAESVSIVAAPGLSEGRETFDLTYSLLRPAGASHQVYQDNMGVRATAAFTVTHNGKLLGLVGLHSREPRALGLHELPLLQSFVDGFSLRLVNQELESEQHYYQNTLENVAAVMRERSSTSGQSESPALYSGSLQQRLEALVDADHFETWPDPDGRSWLAGMPEGLRGALLAWVQGALRRSEKGVLASDALEEEDPTLEGVSPVAAGLLALSMDGGRLLLWFRKEQAHERIWAGDPHQPLSRLTDGQVGPRTSFESWRQLVRNRSRPWQPREVLAAQILRDTLVTQQRRLDSEAARRKSEEANRVKTALVAKVSHELRTPLHAILSFSRQGLEDLQDGHHEELDALLTDIQHAGKRLSGLVNDLLDLSRLQAGIKLDCAPHSLDALVRQAMRELEGIAGERSVALECHIDGDVVVHADAQRLVQVFVNLVSNALRFAPGQTAVSVFARRAVAQGIWEIRVEDEGPGIPAPEREAIFVPFYQVGQRDGNHGAGLGLAICKEIIEAHGGRVWADASPSGGASLAVALPGQFEPDGGGDARTGGR